MIYYKFIENIAHRATDSVDYTFGARKNAWNCVTFPSVRRMRYDNTIRPIVDALSTANTDMVELTTSPLWANVISSVGRPIYFGNAVDQESEMFVPRTVSQSYKVRSGQTAKVYQARLEAGDIVFCNYQVGEVKITSVPGFYNDDIVNRSRISYVRAGGYFVRNEQLPCHPGANWQLDISGDKYWASGTIYDINGSIIPEARFESVYERQVLKAGTLPAHALDIDPGLMPAIETFVQQLKTLKPIKGLVTEVVCEANSGTYDVLTSVMENLRETVPSILELLKSVFKLYQRARGQVKHRRSLSTGSVQADIARIWLQFRYAVQPLAYELNDILDFQDLKRLEFESFRKGRTWTKEFSYNGWTGTIDCVDRCLVRNEYDFSRLYGLKTNLFSTAWELMPLSFVIDWFLNIGDVLTASISPNGLKRQVVNYSTRCEGTMTLAHPDYPGTIVVQLNTYARGPINKSSYIDLEFAPDLSFKRLIDAWAIFWAGVKNPTRYR